MGVSGVLNRSGTIIVPMVDDMGSEGEETRGEGVLTFFLFFFAVDLGVRYM